MGKYSTLVTCHITYKKSHLCAVNDTKTSPRYYRKFPDGNESWNAHAETAALSKIPKSWDPRKIWVYVQRYKKDGSIGMSKPCIHCQAALWRAGILSRHVYFTNDVGEWEQFVSQKEGRL